MVIIGKWNEADNKIDFENIDEDEDKECDDSEDQDNFTNRICENCSKGFDVSDPHYYDEEQGVCYCSEKCYKIDTAVVSDTDEE